MRLTKEENEMLEGKHGFPLQKSMEILVGLGELYEADKMIPITSSHLLGTLTGHRKAGAMFVEEMAEKGGKFSVFTDMNPLSIHPWFWKDKGIPEEFAFWQMKIVNAYAKMGALLCHTCTPYLVGHVPRKGEHVAWSESSAVIFANSVLGARTNREGGPGSLAAALAGRVPAYGYHLDRNRYGDLKIMVTAKLKDLQDYGTLGYFVGRTAQDKVPVLVGIPPSVSNDELKIMGAAANTSGSVALCHVVGVTPEAPTEKAAFGSKKASDWQTLEFGEKELRETEASLSNTTSQDVDLVIFGCPHASVREIRDIARLLSGKKLRSGAELWILTSSIVKTYAEKMGYLNVIETTGAKVLCDTCTEINPGFLKERGHRIAATNTAKMCSYITTGENILAFYASAERCVEVVTR